MTPNPAKTPAHDMFAEGLQALLDGDLSGGTLMAQAMEQAADLPDALDRARTLSDLAVAAYNKRSEVDGPRAELLSFVHATAANNVALSLYEEYEQGEDVFAQELDQPPHREALDAALDTAGKDYADVLSAGWLGTMRSHLAAGNIDDALEAVQGATSSFVHAWGRDSEDAAFALKDAQFAFTEMELHDIGIHLGQRALELLDRADFENDTLRAAVLGQTAFNVLSCGDAESGRTLFEEAHRYAQKAYDEYTVRDDAEPEVTTNLRAVLDGIAETLAAVNAAMLGADDDNDDDEPLGPDEDGFFPWMMAIQHEDTPPELCFAKSPGGPLQWAGVHFGGQQNWVKMREEPVEVWHQPAPADLSEQDLRALSMDDVMALFDEEVAERVVAEIPEAEA